MTVERVFHKNVTESAEDLTVGLVGSGRGSMYNVGIIISFVRRYYTHLSILSHATYIITRLVHRIARLFKG